MAADRLVVITEQLFSSKRFMAVLCFANGVFSLYALLQSFLAGYYTMSLVCALAFFFNALGFAFCIRDWGSSPRGGYNG